MYFERTHATISIQRFIHNFRIVIDLLRNFTELFSNLQSGHMNCTGNWMCTMLLVSA